MVSEHVMQAAQFERWAKSEERNIFEQHAQTQPGGVRHAHYPPEVGRRLSQLRSSRDMLTDFASVDAYTKMDTGKSAGMLDQPLESLLPEHYHHLVRDFRGVSG